MKALSIKQPWASLIIRGGKDIENRDWKTRQRGIIAVHASAKLDEREMGDACCMMEDFIPRFSSQRFRADEFPLGAILGTVELIDCVESSNSPWFYGAFGFLLRNPVAFIRPIPCRGALSFWEVPEGLMKMMRCEYRESLAQAGRLPGAAGKTK